jgi:hypothetical protein
MSVVPWMATDTVVEVAPAPDLPDETSQSRNRLGDHLPSTARER